MSAETADLPDLEQVARDIEACVASQVALSRHVASLDAVDPATPSRLPGWTVGHVMTHIARNADGVLRMLDGLGQYWLGRDSRNADIELGAGREWDELVDDVIATSAAVEARMGETNDWSGSVETVMGRRPKTVLPVARRREVEIHRADLGLGYDFADMPADYVRADGRLLEMQWRSRQPMGLTQLPAAVLQRTEHERLAWLFGRMVIEGVDPAGVI